MSNDNKNDSHSSQVAWWLSKSRHLGSTDSHRRWALAVREVDKILLAITRERAGTKQT